VLAVADRELRDFEHSHPRERPRHSRLAAGRTSQRVSSRPLDTHHSAARAGQPPNGQVPNVACGSSRSPASAEVHSFRQEAMGSCEFLTFDLE
jgi:hypothetical protein